MLAPRFRAIPRLVRNRGGTGPCGSSPGRHVLLPLVAWSRKGAKDIEMAGARS